MTTPTTKGGDVFSTNGALWGKLGTKNCAMCRRILLKAYKVSATIGGRDKTIYLCEDDFPVYAQNIEVRSVEEWHYEKPAGETDGNDKG